jgi:hypothetical protein
VARPAKQEDFPGSLLCGTPKSLIPNHSRAADFQAALAANQKRQTVMIVTGAASDWEYFSLGTNQSLKRQSTFSGGSHD